MEQEENEQRINDELDEEEQEAEGDSENGPPLNNNQIQKHLFQMLMQAQSYEAHKAQEIDEIRENEMMERAIQESLKENPNPDVMNYEQLQELEERIGSVSKGFSDIEIGLIPAKKSTSTKEDCSICLDSVNPNDWVKTLGCGHDFHRDCIDQCLKTTKKCPCCMEEHVIV